MRNLSEWRDMGDKYSRMELTIYAGCWLLLFSLPIFTRVYEVIHGESAHLQWQGILDSYTILLPIFLLFLLNNFVLLPRLFWKRKKGLYYAALIGLFALLWTIQEPPRMGEQKEHRIHRTEMVGEVSHKQHDGAEDPRNTTVLRQSKQHRPKGPIGMFHITNLILELCVIFFNLAIKMYIYSMRRDMQLLSSKNEKIQQELSALKYQIKPHFLMNTLNNIQSLIETNPVTAYRTIQQLSKMMRYMLYENDLQKVELQKELDFMTNFIELMKLRYPDSVRISTDFPSESTSVSIPPLLFISFLENAFKHGIDYSRESMISVRVSVEDYGGVTAHGEEHSGRWLTFHCANFITQRTTSQEKSNGIGIKNVRRRLDLIYGDKYELNISQTDGLYGVEMKLPI